MRVACNIQCQVTEMGKKPFDVPLYEAVHYEGHKKHYKVEYRLVIVRVETNVDNSLEDKEILVKTEWFQKSGADTVRSIRFANTTFSYFEKQDQIYINRNYDIV